LGQDVTGSASASAGPGSYGSSSAIVDRPNFLPANSTLAYTVTWAAGIFTADPKNVAAQVGAALSSKGIARIISESDSSSFLGGNAPGFTLQVLTLQDYGQADDVRRLIDSEVYATGQKIVGSQIGVVKSAAGGQPQPPGSGFGQWLSDNLGWVALGLGAVLVGRELLE
jgi:hypothetical protein